MKQDRDKRSQTKLFDRRAFAGIVMHGKGWAVFLCALVVFSALESTAAAQEFGIITRVYDESAAAGRAKKPAGKQPPVVARTLTLFHAGKAYDYISSVSEVIIFEPAHQRFTLLSTSRAITTQVTFRKLTGMLAEAREVIEIYRSQPKNEDGPSPEVAKFLKFQLAPSFKSVYDKPHRELKLASPFVQYEALCASPKMPQAVVTYLRYADWTCRLNYVLHPHPQSLFPASRLALNDALRHEMVMPVEVRLSIAGETPIRLRAEHKIHWKLDVKDRRFIQLWEMQLKDRNTRRVSFREYQQAMLVNLSKRGR
jgi:hypothetical protein